ncbi:MAG: FHA domain-containing protein [Lachnospiraceae bacterium]|nr:FHA domain-containing protein [Lachnospiraceae bacterium]
MNRKNFMDMIICSFSAAIIILCFTYMEQSMERDVLGVVCGILFLVFLLMAVADSSSGKQKKKGNGQGIQELVLLDEEGNEISAWHIGGKTSLLIGRDEYQENVDINLQNTEYGGMADRQHAVLNYVGGQWFIEDLGSRNGVRIRDAKDRKIYQVSKEHPCRINAGDIIFIGNTRLGAK